MREDRHPRRVLRDEIEAIKEVDPIRGKVIGSLDRYSSTRSHYVTEQQQLRKCITASGRAPRSHRLLRQAVRFLEKQRSSSGRCTTSSSSRDGFCQGIENYSRHLSVERGDRADAHRYFPKDFLLIVDDRTDIPRSARCTAAIAPEGDVGRVRLPPPSALDNRPLKFEEFEGLRDDVVLSATPAIRVGKTAARRRADHPADGLLDRRSPSPCAPLPGSVTDSSTAGDGAR